MEIFLAIYLRLIESLKTQIPDNEERKKHIIENMLYMSELNKKKCLSVGRSLILMVSIK
jgi:hypothetical protein